MSTSFDNRSLNSSQWSWLVLSLRPQHARFAIALNAAGSITPELVIQAGFDDMHRRGFGGGAGSAAEGSSLDWAAFVIAASFNAYAAPNAVPAGQVLLPSQVRSSVNKLLSARAAALWIGHSTFLVRAGGRTILTDPIFSETASPLPTLGPRRYVPPALQIAELPHVDVIVISHNHYDHLDEPSLKLLAQRFPLAQVLMPAGNEHYATDAGFVRVQGYWPGQGSRVADLRFLALPAYHQSSRIDSAPNSTPTLSWSIRADNGVSIFFAGDTAYGPVFRHIRSVYGPYEVALVPIGNYGPPDEVRGVHATPEEAAKIASDLGARLAVGMHWGTFPLSGEPYMEPAERFLAARSAVRRRVLRIGETIAFNKD
jgi:N-acyl-phosphatidylethanolamine-hydrolysing phospholipase D